MKLFYKLYNNYNDSLNEIIHNNNECAGFTESKQCDFGFIVERHGDLLCGIRLENATNVTKITLMGYNKEPIMEIPYENKPIRFHKNEYITMDIENDTVDVFPIIRLEYRPLYFKIDGTAIVHIEYTNLSQEHRQKVVKMNNFTIGDVAFKIGPGGWCLK